MTAPTLTHGRFTLERFYPHAVERVFFAHADKDTLYRWRVSGEGFVVHSHELDFREGGREFSVFRYGDGPEMTFAAEYHVIIPNRRIVNTYWMTMGGEPLSVSLLTLDFLPEGGGARLLMTEQGAYFGDPAAVAGREEGMRELLGLLGVELDHMPG